jgi:hypothetical protein
MVGCSMTFMAYVRAFMPPILIFATLLTIGTCVFRYGEGWEWRDALYVTIKIRMAGSVVVPLADVSTCYLLLIGH